MQRQLGAREIMGERVAELAEHWTGGTIVDWGDLGERQRHRLQEATTGETPEAVIYPQTVEALTEVMQIAHEWGVAVIPMGAGSKLHWGGVVQQAPWVISTRDLDRLVEHAVGDLTVTVEAGAKLRTVEEILAKSQQFLAIDPIYADDATIGGIVATGDMGSWRQRYNSIRDRLIGISFVRHDGQLVKAGGRVVKNVAGYDLMKLLTASYGTLGVISQLTFRLYPLPEASTTLVMTGGASEIEEAMLAIRRSSVVPTALDLLSPGLLRRLQLEGDLGLGIRVQNVAVSVEQQCDRLQELAQRLTLAVTPLEGEEEQGFWGNAQQALEQGTPQERLLLKWGVRPTAMISTLDRLEEILAQVQGNNAKERAIARFYAGSGLGHLSLPRSQATSSILGQLRRHCQANAGFLTILEAPQDLKRHIDPWGDLGTARIAMTRLKQTFDPQTRLSPGRFLA
ncbi:FAD-binding oxidoreductase [Phormidium yuhuli AB48]|uniref:FAD-binding oxidoreductase n=1 Tax=Phormidium yuhuli AB48 TaxID=2940671 RepID=A0ABY5AQ98_9CYAN|nr:FAD-binding oxidoreductase [Phormidium yuhuli]USR91394.1 FAD-binding oxidoreductase [Phormidium yuhuli AB48]